MTIFRGFTRFYIKGPCFFNLKPIKRGEFKFTKMPAMGREEALTPQKLH